MRTVELAHDDTPPHDFFFLITVLIDCVTSARLSCSLIIECSIYIARGFF